MLFSCLKTRTNSTAKTGVKNVRAGKCAPLITETTINFPIKMTTKTTATGQDPMTNTIIMVIMAMATSEGAESQVTTMTLMGIKMLVVMGM